MENYQKKRAIIISVYLLIFFAIVGSILYFNRTKPDCFDDMRNQNEQGVDCGGVCAKKCPVSAQQNLTVIETGFVDSGASGKIDLYGKIDNPNQILGSSMFSYEFITKDPLGNILVSKAGSSFILPGETKYVVENSIIADGQPSVVEMRVGNVEWVEANEFYEKPQLKIVNKNYNEVTNGTGFSEAIGLLKNESPLDFSNIKIEVILKDAYGKIIALNSTEMNTVKSGDNREFKTSWPNRFPGSVSNMEVQTEVNIFDSDAYFQRFFKPEKFQQY